LRKARCVHSLTYLAASPHRGGILRKVKDMTKNKSILVHGLEYTLVAILPMIAVYLGTAVGPIIGKFI
jgi:Na+-transporting NADH:ubiquinone oxidoreductase subunit NqrB